MSSADIKILDDFLSEEDCNYLISTYKDKVFRSRVVGEKPEHSSRTSSSFYIPNTDEVSQKIKIKVANLLQIPAENIETLQFLRYQKGEKYAYHYDLLSGDNIQNQRVFTVLLYLNTLTPQDGGATSFFHYKKKVVPVKGTGVLFRNLNEDGTENKDSLHAGEEILSDDVIKYAINIWTRQKRF
jgi:prolyl 4-hydroxylase